MASGTSPHQLVAQLRSGSRLRKASALKALSDLASSSLDNVAAIHAAEGIWPALVAALGDSSTMIQQSAAQLLARLTFDWAEAKAAAQAAGAVPRLVTLLKSSSCGSRGRGGCSRGDSGSAAAQEVLATALRDVVLNSQGGAAALQAAGGIALVMQLLHSTSQRVQACAASILSELPFESQERTAATVAAGAFDALVPLLWSCSAEVRQEAAWACRNLCWGAEANHMAAIAAGCVPPLLHLLSNSSRQTRKQAVAALHNLAKCNEACAEALVAAGAVAAVVGFLQARDNSSSSSDTDSDRDSSSHSSSASDDSEQGAVLGTAADVLFSLLVFGGHAAVGAALQAAGGKQQLRDLLLTHGGHDADHMIRVFQTDLESSQAHSSAVSTGGAPSDAGGEQQAAERESAAVEGAQPDASPAAAAAAAARSTPAVQPAAPTSPLPATPIKVCAADGCGATHGLRRRGGCASVRYCSVACSRAHWRAHKAECCRLQAAAPAAAAAAAAAAITL